MIPTFLLMIAGVLTTLQADSIQSVELSLRTRGVNRSIVITAQQTQIDINGQRRQQATSPKQWQAILKALETVKLTEMPSLPTDVSRSAVDAALAAHVTVRTTGQTYESATYDHPNPPAPLAPLVKTMVSILPAASRSAFQ